MVKPKISNSFLLGGFCITTPYGTPPALKPIGKLLVD
jgi:hypothetical protein